MRTVNIHASCVAIGTKGVLILGDSGAGKSDLALRLIDDGARLVADDRTELYVSRDALYAQAPKSIAGLIEVRGLGIVALPFRKTVQTRAGGKADDNGQAAAGSRLLQTAEAVNDGRSHCRSSCWTAPCPPRRPGFAWPWRLLPKACSARILTPHRKAGNKPCVEKRRAYFPLLSTDSFMLGLVLVTHGRLAQEFIAAMEHMVGPQTNLRAVCIGPEDDIERRQREIAAAAKAVDTGKGVVIATDMFGGTPCNLALTLLDRTKIEVLAGVNLPSLIKLIDIRNKLPLEQAVKEAIDAGRKYMRAGSADLGAPA